MNKNTILLLLAFVGMGGATYYFLNNKNDKSTITATDKDFRVEEKEIYKIFFADRENHRITLTRDGHSKRFILNGKYTANEGVLKHTMEVLTQIAVRYVPPRAAIENAAKDLAVNGIKVELYGQNDVPLRTFYIGGTTNDGHGTYFIMEGSEQPYVMHLPGFVGEIRPRFSLDEETWRDKTVFEYAPENIKTVSVEYPQQKASSFKISKETFNYSVLPFYDAMPRSNKSLRKGSVQSYLTNFERVIAEGIDNKNEARDSLSRTVPFAIISLTTEKNEQKMVRIFPILDKDEYGRPIQGKKPDRYFAESKEGDFFLVQDNVFRKLFYDYKAFFE